MGRCIECNRDRVVPTENGDNIEPCPACGATEVVVGEKRVEESATVDPGDPNALVEGKS
jgi:hypothetical protein